MKKQAQESLDKIKYLMEFHFKPSSRMDSVQPIPEEQPVKFNEVGDIYKAEEETHDYPSFESYRNDVILDEDEPQDNQGQPQQSPEQPQANAEMPQSAPIAAGQEPQSAQAPQPSAPEAMPPIETPTVPEPAPAPMPEPAPVAEPPAAPAPEANVESAMQAQIAKTDEMLAKFDLIQKQLADMESVNVKLNDVEQKLDDLKNPPYDEQLEMISKKAYPYNIKLSDFWGWDKGDSETEEEPVEFKLSPDDLTSYNKDDIKKSFSV